MTPFPLTGVPLIRPSLFRPHGAHHRRWLGLGLLVAVVSCSWNPPIQIGMIGSFTDPLGRPQRLGAKLAVDQINATGGINGRRIELIEADDRGIPDSAITAAFALARSDVVAVIGGAFSGPTLAAAAVFNDPTNAVVQITPAASAIDVSGAGEWTFRICPSDRSHAAALARFVRQQLGLERGSVLYMNNNYGRGFRDAFEQEFKRLGGTILSADPYLAVQVKEAAAYFDRIAYEGRSQFILAASYQADGAELLRMARARGITAPFLGGDGLRGLERQGIVAEGTYQSAAYLADASDIRNTEWIETYRRANPGEPNPNQTAVGAYDAVHLLARLIAEVGTDRDALRAALAEVGRSRPAYEGISGRIAFDSLGDVPEKRVLIAQARGGAAHAVEEAQ